MGLLFQLLASRLALSLQKAKQVGGDEVSLHVSRFRKRTSIGKHTSSTTMERAPPPWRELYYHGEVVAMRLAFMDQTLPLDGSGIGPL